MTAPAIDKSARIIRALLIDDMETFRRLNADVDSDEKKFFAALLGAAFFKAVNDKFGQDHTVADVIEFVADIRAKYPTVREAVSAEDAERVLRAALGEEDITQSMSAYAKGGARTAMLVVIVRDSGFSVDEIDALIDDSAREVQSYFERRGRR
jgi:hypothetical protein